MKVLAVHNYHRSGSASGDDQVFRHETEMLRSAGIEVIEYTLKNDQFDQAGGLHKILSAMAMLWSPKTYRDIRRICTVEKPDVVHVHTFFPLLSPSVFVAAHRSGVKVVQTLHDTRYVCPVATSLYQNEICKLCRDGHYFRMVPRKCFKNSTIQSFIVAGIFSWHRLVRTFYNNIDRYIYLNESQKLLYLDAGFAESKMVKKYNSIAKPNTRKSAQKLPQRYAVYCGRIGQEKGISFLCKAWLNLKDIPLVVMGGGPEEGMLREFIADHPELPIEYLGYVPHDECQGIIKDAQFLILPSVVYEGCSMVVIEAFSLGKPVVATDIGFMHEAIAEQNMDTVFPLGNMEKFSKVVRRLWQDESYCSEIGRRCLKEYEKKYNEQVDIANLIYIYQELANS